MQIALEADHLRVRQCFARHALEEHLARFLPHQLRRLLYNRERRRDDPAEIHRVEPDKADVLAKDHVALVRGGDRTHGHIIVGDAERRRRVFHVHKVVKLPVAALEIITPDLHELFV